MKLPILSLILALLCLACTQLQWGLLFMNSPTIGTLLSCHLPHLSAGQLFYAGAVAMVFAVFCERQIGARSFFALWLASSLTVSVSVLAFEGDRLRYFCGASGIGHAFAACWAITHENKAARALFLIGLAGKVTFEMVTGTVSYEIGLEGARPIPLAHCAGALAGLLFGLAILRYQSSDISASILNLSSHSQQSR